jgi:hypothetical protein
VRTAHEDILLGLRCTLDPMDRAWQLPAASIRNTTVALIGWVLERPRIDGGPPAAAAAILADALTAHWRVTFLDDEVPGAARWIRAAWWRRLTGRIASPPLHSVSEPEPMMRMFQAGLFGWTMQGQAAFLSARDDGAPDLTGRQVEAVLDGRFDPVRLRDDARIAGVMIPAVDGDYAAISTFDASWPTLEESLRRECSRRDVGWEIVTEAEFSSRPWSRTT